MQSGFIEVTETSSKDRNLRRTVEHTKNEEESFEADKVVLRERIPEEIGVQSGVIEVTETSSQDRNLQRTVEQIIIDYMDKVIAQIMKESFKVDKIVLPERTKFVN